MLSNKQRRYFDVARAVAETSTFKRVRIGAAIVKSRVVLSVGANTNKTHPMQFRYNEFRYNKKVHWASLHAEMCALSRCREDVYGAEIYIFRFDLNYNLAMSRPCAACMQALIDKGVHTIHYTTPNGYATESIDI
jgi:deoxycytidylate deaminase